MGFAAGKLNWITGVSIRELTNLVFLVLLSPLLFRSMSKVHLGELDLKPIGVYFLVATVLFVGMIVVNGWNRRSTVVALSCIFSNTVMIGMPLVRLAFGEAGFVQLVTLISLHALVLLTLATIVLEIQVAQEKAAAELGMKEHGVKTVLRAMKNSILHPVPLPILAGLLFAQTGLDLPPLIDQPLQWLGAAFSPLALLLVGISLAHTKIAGDLKRAFRISLVKAVVHPLLFFAFAWVLGLRGMSLGVMLIAASLPIGANVFLFSQRYKVEQALITASVAVSTGVAVFTVSFVMYIVEKYFT